MYSVMIVEDEMLVRIGLKNGVDWGKFGMAVVAEAANGLQALEKFQEFLPDIIITDIKMPVMDGLELIDKVRSYNRDTKIIVLSCVEEFGTVRGALKHNVSDYILKLTMTTAEIESILGKIQLQLNQSGQKRNDQYCDFRKDAHGLMRELLQNESPEERKILLNKLCTMDLYSKKAPIQVGSIRLECGEGINYSSLYSILEEAMKNLMEGHLILMTPTEYLLIVYCVNGENKHFQDLLKVIKKMQDLVKKYLYKKMTIGLSGIGRSICEVHAKFLESENALDCSYFLGKGTIIQWNNNVLNECKQRVNQALYLLYKKSKKLLSLNDSSLKKYQFVIDKWGEDVNIHKAKSTVTEIIHEVMYLNSVDLNNRSCNAFELLKDYRNQLYEVTSLAEQILVFDSYIEQLVEKEKNKQVVSKELAEAIHYMKHEYSNQLFLDDVANMVGLSPNYLSSLFKKELNQNFVEYLNTIRVEEAKELLTTSQMKLYEVANSVGYSDGSYFSRIFKRIVGCRPSEYKKGYIERVEDES